MRRFTGMVAVMLLITVIAAACGSKKDAGAVVQDLNSAVKKMESYSGSGTMILHTGQQPQEYAVDVWYQNPHYYRISLTNEKKDITQIVLRNDEGVFVLTPHLNKSFRFQSNWPENQGQVYLYQTLVQSILNDNNRQFATEKENYLFQVAANYHNGSLAKQKIWLNKSNFAPRHVEVLDNNDNVMVVVDFKSFEFGKKFAKDDFDMQRNMTSWNLESIPTMAEVDEDGNIIDNSDKPQADATKGQAEGSFGVIEPAYIPDGVAQKDEKDVKLGENNAVMLRFQGDYNFTLVESRPAERTVSLQQGELVDLGYTWGVLTGSEQRTLAWMNDGVEFRLTSGDLPVTEMVFIAQSVDGQIGK